MITSQFKQFLYSKTMDTALVAAAECAEVGQEYTRVQPSQLVTILCTQHASLQ